ncbi:MAG: HAMP domain-containing protein [Acidaminococcaceae bacterium]
MHWVTIKPSVRKLIIIVFIVNIVFFTALIGFLAYMGGVDTMRKSARNTAITVSDNVTQVVFSYIEEPYRLEMVNSNAIINKQIDFSDQAQVDKHFVSMLKTFPHIFNNYFISVRGEEFGARHEEDGSFLVYSMAPSGNALDYYKYNERTGRQGYVKSLLKYDPLARPPYMNAVSKKKAAWTGVYQSATGKGLAITRTAPVYNTDRSLLGVVSCSLLLDQLNVFLRSLDVTENSAVFILTSKGEVIASSDVIATTACGISRPAIATEKSLALLAVGLETLEADGDPLTKSPVGKRDLEIVFNGHKYFLHAVSIPGDVELGLMNLVFIPEKDATQFLQEFAGKLVIITIFAFFVALISGVLMSRYIVNPLININQMARKIAEGDFSHKVKTHRNDEVGQLANTVNEMSTKLERQFEVEKKAADTERKMHEQERRLHKAASRFVPYGFLQMLGKGDILKVESGDHVEREMTILFTDMRSYTQISEGMSNEALFKFVNRYLDLAVKAITKNNGLIDKFIGDAIMGLFLADVDDALRAIIELRNQMRKAELNYNGDEIVVGAGIHYGSVTLGTVGTAERMDTTALGDSVNLAARLENATKIYGVSILISEQAYLKIKHPENFSIREVDVVRVKGKNQTITLYEVFDCDPDEIKKQKQATMNLFARGLELYRKGDFAQAEIIFRECQKIGPQDKLLEVYIKRSNVLLRVPPNQSWKGINGI